MAALAIAELIARVVIPPVPNIIFTLNEHPDGVAANQVEKHLVNTYTNSKSAALYRYTPIGIRLAPNYRVVVENHEISGRTIEIETNSIGYRNEEIYAKQGMRILFLGDSITFGGYLPEEETFVRRVQDAARADGLAWETINAGISGIGLKNEISILAETGIGLRPDVVVLCFYLNDHQDSPGVFAGDLPTWLSWSRLGTTWWRKKHWVSHSPAYFRLNARKKELEQHLESQHVNSDRATNEFLSRVIRNFEDWGAAWSPAIWDDMRPYFEKFREFADKREFLPLAIIFPVRDQVWSDVLHDAPQKNFRNIMESLDVPVLDVLPLLRRARSQDFDELFYDQCHHTPAANQLIAEEITGFLLKHLEETNDLSASSRFLSQVEREAVGCVTNDALQ